MAISAIIPAERVYRCIYVIRGRKVLLDEDLAELYGVQTRVLNQAVSRNTERFPEDFMFRLTAEEFANLKSQVVTSSSVSTAAGRPEEQGDVRDNE